MSSLCLSHPPSPYFATVSLISPFVLTIAISRVCRRSNICIISDDIFAGWGGVFVKSEHIVPTNHSPDMREVLRARRLLFSLPFLYFPPYRRPSSNRIFILMSLVIDSPRRVFPLSRVACNLLNRYPALMSARTLPRPFILRPYLLLGREEKLRFNSNAIN